MHLHGVSEHTVNGAYYPLEAHMVHIPADEELDTATVSQALVIGIFLSPGAKARNKIMDIVQRYVGASHVRLMRVCKSRGRSPDGRTDWID